MLCSAPYKRKWMASLVSPCASPSLRHLSTAVITTSFSTRFLAQAFAKRLANSDKENIKAAALEAELDEQQFRLPVREKEKEDTWSISKRTITHSRAREEIRRKRRGKIKITARAEARSERDSPERPLRSRRRSIGGT